jgi:hypothetical protein
MLLVRVRQPSSPALDHRFADGGRQLTAMVDTVRTAVAEHRQDHSFATMISEQIGVDASDLRISRSLVPLEHDGEKIRSLRRQALHHVAQLVV